MIYFLQLVAIDFTVGDGIPIWKVALAIHIGGWILQFIGHGVFEGTYFHKNFIYQLRIENPRITSLMNILML